MKCVWMKRCDGGTRWLAPLWMPARLETGPAGWPGGWACGASSGVSVLHFEKPFWGRRRPPRDGA